MAGKEGIGDHNQQRMGSVSIGDQGAVSAARKTRAMQKPDGVSYQEWLIRLHSERADTMRQIRQMVHTSRGCGGMYRYVDRLDATIKTAEACAKAEGRP